MSTIGGSSAATSATAGMVSGVKGASGSLNPTATNFVPPPLGVRLDGGGHGAQDSGRKSKADPWADQFEWMDKKSDTGGGSKRGFHVLSFGQTQRGGKETWT